MSKYNFEQKRNDYMTPDDLIKNILIQWDRKEFDLDVCCTKKNIPALCHNINGITDGLSVDWFKFNWMNPPFDTSIKWVKKAHEQQLKGNTTVALLPVRTETKFWHDYIIDKPNVYIKFLRKGLCFIDPETMKPVQQKVKQKDNTYKFVDGVFKNALAIVIFKGVENE